MLWAASQGLASLGLAREAAERVVPQECVRLSVLHLRPKDVVNGCLFDRGAPKNRCSMYVQNFPGARASVEQLLILTARQCFRGCLLAHMLLPLPVKRSVQIDGHPAPTVFSSFRTGLEVPSDHEVTEQEVKNLSPAGIGLACPRPTLACEPLGLHLQEHWQHLAEGQKHNIYAGRGRARTFDATQVGREEGS